MKTRNIGSLSVSIVGLGCNNFGTRLGAPETAKVVHAALDAGINFFDTADIYGKSTSESFLATALGSRRKDIVLATKFGKPVDENRKGASPAYIRQAVEDSLRRLNTDYIDLYQIHQPDPNVPIEDTLGALNELVQAGKVREIGCSNFSAAQIREAAAVDVPQKFASVQNEYSLLYRGDEQDAIPECERLGLAYLPYYPLASGLLTGKYRGGVPQGSRLESGWYADRLTEKNLNIIEKLIEFSEERSHTILELAICWLLARPVVASVISGATSAEQVTTNAGAAVWTLSHEDLLTINAIVSSPSES